MPTLPFNTFGEYSASRANPKWVKRVDADIVASIESVLKAELAETEGELIHLTILGCACGSSSLSFESGLRQIKLIRPLVVDAPAFHLLVFIQVLPKMDTLFIHP